MAAPIRKIRLPGARVRSRRVKITPPSAAFIWNIGQPTCPHCRMIFNIALINDDEGNPVNYNLEKNEITVQHPDSMHRICPSQGKRFRYKIPSVEVTEV